VLYHISENFLTALRRHTFLIFETYAFPLQQCSRERASVLRYSTNQASSGLCHLVRCGVRIHRNDRTKRLTVCHLLYYARYVFETMVFIITTHDSSTKQRSRNFGSHLQGENISRLIGTYQCFVRPAASMFRVELFRTV